MRKLPFILFLMLLVLLASIGAAAQEKPACPELSVTGPSVVPKPGDIIAFTANVIGADKIADLKYKWSISHRDILKGNGTDRIDIKFQNYKYSLTATVEITGFPSNCQNIASETLYWDPPPQARLISATGCPKISVETSPVAVIDGYPMIFTAKITGAEISKLKLKWTLSNGEILEGQGTTVIRVDTLGYQGEEIKATLEVLGLPRSCTREASATGVVKKKDYLQESLECPGITITRPSSPVRPGDDMVFTANIFRIDAGRIEYEWAASAGTITSGQGTPVIRIATDKSMRGSNVTVELQIKGLPEECENRASEVGSVGGNGGTPRMTDQYEKLSWAKEKERLKNAAWELEQTNGKGILLIYIGTRGSSAYQKKKRIADIENYFFRTLKISKT